VTAGALLSLAASLSCGGGAFSAAPDDGGAGNGSSGSSSSSGGVSGSSGSGASSSSGVSGSSSSGSGGRSSSGGHGSSSGASSSSGSGSGGASSSSGSGSSGASSDAGCGDGCLDAGGGSSPCPATAPAQDSACLQNTLECEYGSSPVPSCDTIATCTGLKWQVVVASASTDCPASLGPQCPASFASVPQDMHCATNDLVCDYPQGRCACTVGEGPVVIVVGDASTADRWLCQTPAAGCPTPRPPLGTACTGTLFCDYGSCAIPGGTSEECEDGLWKTALVACPALAAGP
jgi:hypothetical protein